MPGSLLTVEGLTLERGGRVLLQNFNLQVAAGELIQVEGGNGTGKTSLLRYLAGLSSFGNERNIQRTNCSQLYLGHKAAIKPLLTPRENLDWYCRGHGWDTRGIDDALQQVGLFGYEDVHCQNLSAGQQRRVGLARLYLSDAKLWLLDEPFTSIDADGVIKLAALLEQRASEGAAIVVTSHQALPVQYPLRRVKLGAQLGVST